MYLSREADPLIKMNGLFLGPCYNLHEDWAIILLTNGKQTNKPIWKHDLRGWGKYAVCVGGVENIQKKKSHLRWESILNKATMENKSKQATKQTRKKTNKKKTCLSRKRIIFSEHPTMSFSCMTASVKQVSKITKKEFYQGNYLSRAAPANVFHSWLLFDESSRSLLTPSSLSHCRASSPAPTPRLPAERALLVNASELEMSHSTLSRGWSVPQRRPLLRN